MLKQTYHYDKLGQLIRMDDTVTNCTYGYRYNAGGNLTGMDVYDQYIDPDDPDYTSYNLLTTRDYRYQDSGNWKDLLTYYFGSTITYDDIGNPLNYRNGMTMTWEKGRRLASVTNSGVTTAYTYNDDGIRLTKKVGNNALVTYETDGGLILCQKTGTGSSAVYIYFFYDASGNAYAMEYDGDMYYYLRNGQNDVIGIIDDTGAVVARYTYDPWGKPLTVKDSNGVDIAANATHVANVNPFRYRGYFYDVETGFYYLQSRYYDPVTGRFINADGYVSTGQGVLGNNMFTYCGNNPINLVDPSGQFLGGLLDGIFDFFGDIIVEIGKAFSETKPAFAACGEIAVADGPLPFGDALALVGAAALTLGAFGVSVYRAATQEKSVAISKPEEIVVSKESNNPVLFPANPNHFNPIGLVKVHRPGTKNGALISWMYPIVNIEVFRWDENINYPNGSHYHIYGAGHYYPGDIVPEPFASIYFPIK